MACVIQGYEDAVDREQLARNLVYLDQCETVCNEPIRNITPRSLALLNAMRTPFLTGGKITAATVSQFIWALHRDYSPRSLKAWWKRRQLRNRLAKLSLEFCMGEIQAFIDLTFMDAPTGGKEEKPIASNIAWLIYRFRHDPWRMSEQETSNTPLRKLYQELRCWERENDKTPANRSDILKTDWLNDLNAWLAEDPIANQRILDAWNEKNRAIKEWRN